MKIENRVEALELELKILKNEIQSTLLEIREQVLNHYYPELRAEEPARAKHVAQKPSEARPSRAIPERSNGNSRTKAPATSASSAEAKAQIQPFTDIFLQDIDLDDDDDLGAEPSVPQYRTHKLSADLNADLDEDEIEFDDDEDEEEIAPTSRPAAVAPKTREVVLQQLKQSAAVPTPMPKAKIKNSPEKELVEPPVQKPNRRAFAALAAWVGDSVAKVGKERTIQVVETYAASGGNLSSETKSTILQLASLANDTEPATPAGNQEMLGLMVGLDQILGEA